MSDSSELNSGLTTGSSHGTAETEVAETGAANESESLRGTVKWFNDAKGFGFIEHPSGKDVFVHYSSIQTEGFKTLKDGEEVHYQIKEGPKGLHAVRVIRSLAASTEVEVTQDAVTHNTVTHNTVTQYAAGTNSGVAAKESVMQADTTAPVEVIASAQAGR